MMRFAEIFPDSEIVTPLVSQLSWTHFTLLIKLPSDESRSFYIHRTLELKIGRFKAGYKSQMELYLNWLDKYERRPGEAAPTGLILCAEAGIEQVELLNMPKDNILIAEYWTDLPPKELLEKKLHDALIEVRERLEERRFLEMGMS